MPLFFGFSENSRGLGVADMADSIKNNTPHRASMELITQVLDVMHGFHISSDQGKLYKTGLK